MTLRVFWLHVYSKNINFVGMEWDKSLTLVNDPTCSLATLVVLKYIGWSEIKNLNLKNEPICSLAQRVVMKYKLHLYGAGSNLKLGVGNCPVITYAYLSKVDQIA